MNLAETASPIEWVWFITNSISFGICLWVFTKFWRALRNLFDKGLNGLRRLAAWLLVTMSATLTIILFSFVTIGLVALLTPDPPRQIQDTGVSLGQLLSIVAFIFSAFVAALCSIIMLVIYNRIINYAEPMSG